MISLDQIRLLEERVLGVVARLNELREENRTLREALASYQSRIEELEERMKGYTDSQIEIEKGILNALQQLDELEDEVTETAQSQPAVAAKQETSKAPEADSATVAEPASPKPTSSATEEPSEGVEDKSADDDDIVVETDDDVKTGPELEIF